MYTLLNRRTEIYCGILQNYGEECFPYFTEEQKFIVEHCRIKMKNVCTTLQKKKDLL